MPSNLASASTPAFEETLIGGTLQGRRQFDVRGASRVCKRRQWRLAVEIAGMVGVLGVERCLRVPSYREVKEGVLLEGRRRVKGEVRGVALKGWVRKEGGEEFRVDDVEI